MASEIDFCEQDGRFNKLHRFVEHKHRQRQRLERLRKIAEERQARLDGRFNIELPMLSIVQDDNDNQLLGGGAPPFM